jgi:hypothetical protein
MLTGERWVGLQKIHESFYVRGVVQGGVDVEEEKVDMREKISGQELIDKNKKITKETNKLKKLFKELPENKKKMAEKLIENASFMSITLDELKEDIKIYGVKETYVNGKDQFGFKESIESKTYNTMVKNYMNIIKQLNDMLPEDKKINEDDEFERFNGSL